MLFFQIPYFFLNEEHYLHSNMKKRRPIALLFILIAVSLGILFYSKIVFPEDVRSYLRLGTYDQFGPLAISIELFFAGLYLLRKHEKTNFALAVFAFTALLDPFFNLTGIFTTMVPVYGTLLFVGCALISLWVAFSNAFGTGKISVLGAVGSFLFGLVIELFFNSF